MGLDGFSGPAGGQTPDKIEPPQEVLSIGAAYLRSIEFNGANRARMFPANYGNSAIITNTFDSVIDLLRIDEGDTLPSQYTIDVGSYDNFEFAGWSHAFGVDGGIDVSAITTGSGNGRITVIDVSDPTSPTERFTFADSDLDGCTALGTEYSGSSIYAIDGNNNLCVSYSYDPDDVSGTFSKDDTLTDPVFAGATDGCEAGAAAIFTSTTNGAVSRVLLTNGTLETFTETSTFTNPIRCSSVGQFSGESAMVVDDGNNEVYRVESNLNIADSVALSGTPIDVGARTRTDYSVGFTFYVLLDTGEIEIIKLSNGGLQSLGVQPTDGYLRFDSAITDIGGAAVGVAQDGEGFLFR